MRRSREGGQEGGEGEEEVLPFLTLTFCTSTLIWGAQWVSQTWLQLIKLHQSKIEKND